METLLRFFTSKDITLISSADAGFTDEVEENGSTFEENAMIKAKAVARSGFCVIADDSGLEVDILGGEPGIYSARYCGRHGDDEANNRLLLNKLENVRDNERTARFVCALAFVYPERNAEFTVRGTCEGYITRSPSGNNGFGYDPLFMCPECGKTFAEMTAEEKDRVSHRSDAVKKLAERLFQQKLL